MYPIYNMYDQQVLQQQAAVFHEHQEKQIIECLHKLNDFLDSAEKIAPAYQAQLLAAACGVILIRQQKNQSA